MAARPVQDLGREHQPCEVLNFSDAAEERSQLNRFSLAVRKFGEEKKRQQKKGDGNLHTPRINKSIFQK